MNKTIKIIARFIIKTIAAVIILLFVLEGALQLAGLIYTNIKYKKFSPSSLDSSFNLMFIGDSWTQGADAAPEPGFSSRTVGKINEILPEMNCIEYNFAWSGTNSSQAVHQFFDNFKEANPAVVIILTGANNGWNTRDIGSARRRLINAINEGRISPIKNRREEIVNFCKNLKVFKLYLLIKEHLFKSKNTLYDTYSDPFSRTYFKILSERRDNKPARQYLLDNFSEDDHDYLNFFKLLLHSCEGNIDNTISCLKENKLWKPQKLEGKFDIEANKRYINQSVSILKNNLKGLKRFCDSRNIILVIQNYPHPHLGFRNLNQSIGKIASELDAVYVNHDRYFETVIGRDEWLEVSTQGHVNARGHEYMADNLSAVLIDLIKKGID